VADTTTEFFEGLGRRGHEPLWSGVTGTARFDIADGGTIDQWFVAIDKGDVTVSHGDGDADCTIRADRELFEKVTSGEANAMAAVLRGVFVVSGDIELLYAIQRVLPGPPRGHRPAPSEEVSR
jgi:ubiquinone biosynthesis protein UbiJ